MQHELQPAVSAGSSRRVAVVGGGFAGIATAHYLAASASVDQPTVLHLYDIAGLGSGGSGAAGGLLHPFSPKGKLLWKGQEAFEAALELIAAAEHASNESKPASDPFVWRQDILRPAADASQAAGFEVLRTGPVGTSASVQAINAEQAHELLPGLTPSALPSHPAGGNESAVALLIGGGLVLHPERYLRHLWQSCERVLTQLQNGSEASLRLQQVQSLAELEQQHGPYDAIVVAAGAAAGMLPEVGDALPVRLSQGYGLELVPPRPDPDLNQPQADSAAPGHLSAASQHPELSQPSLTSADTPRHPWNSPIVDYTAALHSTQFPEGAPSLVGSTYIGVQGGQQISVGAIKQFGFSAEQALQECGRQVTDAGEVAQAEALLRPRAEGLWDPASSWRVARVRSGVRALPQKTADGAIPLTGKLPSSGNMHNWWIVGGLGARGLVYHAWLGKLIAHAALEGTEDGLPDQLLRWKASMPKAHKRVKQ
ncbi:hypothetical protein ABBQ32_002016 [Trebouxia sp. C0010 RCD-2024]